MRVLFRALATIKLENQHFVPKVCLRSFSNDTENESIFGSKYISSQKKWTNPKSYALEKICFAGDFYNLNEAQQNHIKVKSDHVERNSFWYEKSYVRELCEQLENFTLDTNLIKLIPRFYLGMKQRNPKFRLGYSKDAILKVLPKSLIEVKEKWEKFGISEYQLDQIVNNVKKDFVEKDKSKELHTNAILKASETSNLVFEEVLDKLKSYKLQILSINSCNEAFIYSDNPGYSVDKKTSIYNTKFIDDLFHFMPMTPYRGFVLINTNEKKDNLSIEYKKLNRQEVFLYNWGTAIVRQEYLYSHDKNILKKFIKVNTTNSG